MSHLWDKGKAADLAMLRFTARDDWQLDQQLLEHDLRASKAHVRGLGRIGALDPADTEKLVAALDALEAERAAGDFVLSPQVEDGHTAIEMLLTERLGDLGKRVHLGRSRNDQVLVASRLYLRAELDKLALACLDIAATFLATAHQHQALPMPGYTHLQRAVPQSVGHWAACFVEGFGESARALLSARDFCDGSPLGAAAGYGVNLPLDRDGVAAELGFSGLNLNPLWSQTSRGMTETLVVAAVWHASATARRLAWDVSLFVSEEFGMVNLPDELTTGSSIMPNKRNPDVVELLRASCSIVQGSLNELMSLSALPAGYHRDLQLTKGATMRALGEARDALGAAHAVASALTFNEGRMRAAITSDMLATDRAVDLARTGMPFREAYRQVAAELAEQLPTGDERPAGGSGSGVGGAADASLARRVSTGAAGNLQLERLQARLVDLRGQLVARGLAEDPAERS